MASFFAPFFSLFISPFQSTETGSRDEHSKHKWQNILLQKEAKFYACYHDFGFLTVPDPFPKI